MTDEGCFTKHPLDPAESRRKTETGRFSAGMGKGIVLPVILILLWQLVGTFELISKTVLPAPLDILLTFRDLIVSGELFTHLGISIQRAALGFFLGAGLGLLLGLVIGFSKIAEDYLDPSANAENRSASRRHAAVYLMVRFRRTVKGALDRARRLLLGIYQHIFRNQGRRFETVRCGESIGVPLAEAGD